MKPLVAPLLLATAAFNSLFAEEPEWAPLFDEVAYEDFYFMFEEDDVEPEDVFEFKEDSGLLIKGKDKPPGFIQTLDEYANYELKFEWRWPDEPGNSGIQIHSTADQSFSIWPECIEVQMEHENVGDFWLLNSKITVEESQMPKKAADRNRRLKLEDAEEKPGKWNEMRIVAKDDTIKVYLNDELVNEGTEASRDSGYITIQAEDSDLELRKVYIRDLPEEDQ